MSDPTIEIRVYQNADAEQVVALWREDLFDPLPTTSRNWLCD